MLGPTLASTADFLPTREGFVYALVAPGEPERARYVGSTLDPLSRLVAHVQHRYAAVALRAWTDEVLARGEQIIMRHLATDTNRQRLYDIEAEHIRRFWAIGQCDLNKYAGDGEKPPGSLTARDRRIRNERAKIRG